MNSVRYNQLLSALQITKGSREFYFGKSFWPLVNLNCNYKCLYLTQFLTDFVKFWILNHMTKPNKPYDTTPRLDPSIQGLYPSS